MKMESLHITVDGLAGFLQVPAGTREECLLSARGCILVVVERGIRHSAVVALTIA